MQSVVVKNGKVKLWCWFDSVPFECPNCEYVNTCKASKYIRKILIDIKRKELYEALK